MKITFRYDNMTDEVEAEATESSVYEAIGKKIYELAEDIPCELEVEVDGHGSSYYSLGVRGSFKKNGVEMPSMYVTEHGNSIKNLAPSDYEDAYLTCINPESNNYKFYHLKPNANCVNATYGRIGSNRYEAFGVRDVRYPYPHHMYWIRYYEKLSKGYIDQSNIYLAPQKKTVKKKKKKSATGPSAELYATLMRYARHVVDENLVNSKVTAKQAKEARKIYNELCKKVQLKAFNRWLMKLLVLSPRKIDASRRQSVRDYLAKGKDDYSRIIQREENLLLAMEAVATGEIPTTAADTFAKFGIDVFEATESQKKKVIEKLSPQLQPKVKNVYRVIPKDQKKKFDDYVEKNNIKKIKELWHGSRNENWFGIIQNSLQLHPNALITGKMFGDGIYFAPSSMKSWGYTSYYGTYWAGGNQNTAFMGIFAVAYGKSYKCGTHGCHMNQKQLKKMGYDCLHATPAKTGLRNDEIVFYDEHAVCLNYIVEFN